MLRSTPPRCQARVGGQRAACLFPSRSQPDLTLVGVRSVFSSRPFSAPHTTRQGPGAAQHNFHAACCSSSHSDVTFRAGSQAGPSEDTLSEAQESEDAGQYEEGDEDDGDSGTTSRPSDASSVGVPRAIPKALLGIHAQVSRDSALGSSIDGAARLPLDGLHERDLPLDTPRDTEDIEERDEDATDTEEEEQDAEDREEEQQDTENGVQDTSVLPLLHKPDEDHQQETQDSEEVPQKNSKQCHDKTTHADEGTDGGTSTTEPGESPLRPDTLNTPQGSKTKRKQPHKPYSRDHVLKQMEPHTRPLKILTSTAPRPYPMTPPPLTVTSDPGPKAKDDQDASQVNVQEVIDVRLAEAHRSGHLNLSNLGLPFFPSAVLLADTSVIHRLSLQDNRLVELPAASLSQLTYVTWLDLRYNLLAYLPQEIGALVSLQVLLLQGNRLTSLPTSLGTLPALVTLQVSDNPLTFPPEEVIRGGARAILLFLREACTATITCSASSSRDSDTPTSTPVRIPVTSWDSTSGEMKYEHLIYDESVICQAEDAAETTDEGDEGTENEEEKDDEAGDLYGVTGGVQGDAGNLGACQRYLECPPSPMPSLRVAIRTSREEVSSQHHPTYYNQAYNQGLHLPLHAQAQDSDGDTLAAPTSPVSPCLLTPNTDLPTRTTFDLTREGLEAFEKELVMTLQLEGLAGGISEDLDTEALLSFTQQGLEVLERIPDGEVKQRLLRYLGERHTLTEAEFEGNCVAHHRRALHLHLQGGHQYYEDDSESLQGDLGEGYRRPYSQVLEDEAECPKKVSPLPLPVVSLELPTGETCSAKEDEDVRRISQGRSKRSYGSGRKVKRGGSNRLSKTKLATVAEVHRRAREERRRQREILAATMEMTEAQRLRSMDGLEAWREETRLLQEQRTFNPEGYLPVVCEAPFAVDGTMLTPRARSRLKSSGGVRSSLSPSVSEVCAGVRSCLEELKRTKTEQRRGDGGGEDADDDDTAEGGRGRGGGGGGKGGGGGRVVGGSLGHPATMINQLHHLRRQLHRLKVNCVI